MREALNKGQTVLHRENYDIHFTDCVWNERGVYGARSASLKKKAFALR